MPLRENLRFSKVSSLLFFSWHYIILSMLLEVRANISLFLLQICASCAYHHICTPTTHARTRAADHALHPLSCCSFHWSIYQMISSEIGLEIYSLPCLLYPKKKEHNNFLFLFLHPKFAELDENTIRLQQLHSPNLLLPLPSQNNPLSMKTLTLKLASKHGIFILHSL
jgi:hypothetical protein